MSKMIIFIISQKKYLCSYVQIKKKLRHKKWGCALRKRKEKKKIEEEEVYLLGVKFKLKEKKMYPPKI